MSAKSIQNRVLVRVLGQMSPAGRADLLTYISCPLFNENERIVQLLELLEERILPQTREDPSLEELLAGSGIPAAAANKLFSALFRLTNDFLEWQVRKELPGESYRYLWDAYEHLQIESSIREKEYRRAQKTFSEPPLDTRGLQLAYYVSHSANLGRVHDGRREVPTWLLDSQVALDVYYVTERLRYLCATRNVEWIFNLPRENRVEEEVRSLYRAHEEEMGPLAEAYRMILDLFGPVKLSVEMIHHVQNFLLTECDAFSEVDLRDLWGYLLNHCTSQLALDRSEFTELADEIYQILLKKGWLLEAGKISAFHFNNIVKLRLDVGALDWTEQFIRGFAPRLVNDFGGAVERYSWGLWNYHRGDFRAAIRIFKALLETPPRDIFWNLDLRSLLWKSFFENKDVLTPDEVDEMLSLYHSFRIFVSRNEQIPEASRRGYIQFIRFINRLILILEVPEPKRDALEELKAEIEASQALTSRRWLLQQISTYLGG